LSLLGIRSSLQAMCKLDLGRRTAKTAHLAYEQVGYAATACWYACRPMNFGEFTSIKTARNTYRRGTVGRLAIAAHQRRLGEHASLNVYADTATSFIAAAFARHRR
jgi:hypothetical protein